MSKNVESGTSPQPVPGQLMTCANQDEVSETETCTYSPSSFYKLVKECLGSTTNHSTGRQAEVIHVHFILNT